MIPEQQEAQEGEERIAVRLGMDLTEAERIAELLPRLPADIKLRMHDQLWLKSMLELHLPRVPTAERGRFQERANRLLEALDPQEEPTQDTYREEPDAR